MTINVQSNSVITNEGYSLGPSVRYNWVWLYLLFYILTPWSLASSLAPNLLIRYAVAERQMNAGITTVSISNTFRFVRFFLLTIYPKFYLTLCIATTVQTLSLLLMLKVYNCCWCKNVQSINVFYFSSEVIFVTIFLLFLRQERERGTETEEEDEVTIRFFYSIARVHGLL